MVIYKASLESISPLFSLWESPLNRDFTRVPGCFSKNILNLENLSMINLKLLLIRRAHSARFFVLARFFL